MLLHNKDDKRYRPIRPNVVPRHYYNFRLSASQVLSLKAFRQFDLYAVGLIISMSHVFQRFMCTTEIVDHGSYNRNTPLLCEWHNFQSLTHCVRSVLHYYGRPIVIGQTIICLSCCFYLSSSFFLLFFLA